jgi:hypothetical protein
VCDEVVAQCLAETGIAEPPVHARKLARRVGLSTLAEQERRPGRARRRVAEFLLPRVAARLGRSRADVTPAEAQRWMRALTQRLAAPTEWILRDGLASGWNLPALAVRYACSPGLIARRMLAVCDGLTVTIFADNWLVFRESRPAQARPLTALELTCRTHLLTSGHWVDLQQAGRRVQGWAFARRGRNREVLVMSDQLQPAAASTLSSTSPISRTAVASERAAI